MHLDERMDSMAQRRRENDGRQSEHRVEQLERQLDAEEGCGCQSAREARPTDWQRSARSDKSRQHGRTAGKARSIAGPKPLNSVPAPPSAIILRPQSAKPE